MSSFKCSSSAKFEIFLSHDKLPNTLTLVVICEEQKCRNTHLQDNAVCVAMDHGER
jgi:hypothetical protein